MVKLFSSELKLAFTVDPLVRRKIPMDVRPKWDIVHARTDTLERHANSSVQMARNPLSIVVVEF